MATPADERLLEVLEKWLKSLELHLRYSSLDADSYAAIQPWPEHQRPSRWIIDLAVQKTTALKSAVEARIKKGDTQFSESLELMTFLANLVGSEHIERFIPLADSANERALGSASAAAPPPDTSTTTSTTVTREMPVSVTATREMPKFAGAKRPPPAAPPVSTPHVTRTERKSAHSKPHARSAHKPAARQPAHAPPPKHAAHARSPEVAARAAELKREAAQEHVRELAREQVVADAVRLVQWGRKWYELAELIARMADRPPLPEVRRILRDYKTAIEKKAGRG